ncbi:extracellular solute-binding protein [Alginatibacterium sediminis]|uniref:Extracellular solute-binding protein n=1 Tax=Alginatibacterium sediminis TaxID=2164068 RepID=A0A420EI19_9ALTE|nr:extracellular solute-binding protein [Alginatibacterium sediminis]RKF20318.1 extracellular solute-binding protein [Alginatibacterium sediminis]
MQTRKLTLIAGATMMALSANTAWAEKITLTVASFPSFDAAVTAAIPLYKKINPDVEIKLVSLAYNDHHNAMTTALATNSNLPDVMGVEADYMGRFANSSGLYDLRQAPFNSGEIEAKFSPFAVPLAAGEKGQLSGMPADIGPGAMFYRSDIMEKAGVSVEDLTKDWDSFIEAGVKVREVTGQYMMSNVQNIVDIVIRSGIEDGGGVYFDAEGEILVESERFQEAFRLAKKAREAGLDGKIAAWSNEWSEGLRRGDIAVEFMGAWLGGHLANWIAPDSAGDWATANLPNDSWASWGGSYYAIPKSTEHQAEAWEFITFMTTNKEMQLLAFEEIDAFPALIEAQDGPFFDQPLPYLGGQKARLQYKEAAAQIPAISVNKLDPVAKQVIADALESVLERDVAVDKALADAAKLLKRRARRK